MCPHYSAWHNKLFNAPIFKVSLGRTGGEAEEVYLVKTFIPRTRLFGAC